MYKYQHAKVVWQCGILFQIYLFIMEPFFLKILVNYSNLFYIVLQHLKFKKCSLKKEKKNISDKGFSFILFF